MSRCGCAAGSASQQLVASSEYLVARGAPGDVGTIGKGGVLAGTFGLLFPLLVFLLLLLVLLLFFFNSYY